MKNNFKWFNSIYFVNHINEILDRFIIVAATTEFNSIVLTQGYFSFDIESKRRKSCFSFYIGILLYNEKGSYWSFMPLYDDMYKNPKKFKYMRFSLLENLIPDNLNNRDIHLKIINTLPLEIKIREIL